VGFVNRTGPRFPSQGIASQGGLIPRAFAFFTAAHIQIPPPPGPEFPPSPTLERFGMLVLALILIFALVLLALPNKVSRKVIKIAFCIGKGR
jgi:hypothetical protein